MNIYLASGTTYQLQKKLAVDEIRKIYPNIKVYILETFLDKWLKRPQLLTENYICMLDSGAFSFLNLGRQVDWDEYISRYIEYINANDIKLFFELDIDKIIGYERVKEIRRKLERETGKQPIPVWHRHLGKKEFLRMCDEYNYIALGGIAIQDIKVAEYKYLPALIREAHKHGTKIHGLGFTYSKWLSICHFDSVDSTSWTAGMRYGQIYTFTGKGIRFKKKPPGRRVKSVECAIHNFKEWLKFAHWAETHL